MASRLNGLRPQRTSNRAAACRPGDRACSSATAPARLHPANSDPKDPVLSQEAFLTIYYLGYGFVIFLAWVCITGTPNRPADHHRRRVLQRLAAVAGVLHPALALTGRDIAAQLAATDGQPDPNADRITGLTNLGLAVSLVLAALVIASHFRTFEDVAVFGHIRDRLPFG